MIALKFLYGFIAVAFTACVNGQPSMQTQSDTVTVATGQSVKFQCRVLNVPANQKVMWHFVDHNVTISTGDVIIGGNVFDGKYSITRPADSMGFWNLNIFDVDSSDVGTYQCYVNGSNPLSQVTHHLEVSGLPTKQPAPNFNVTDCCMKDGVEECAIDLCDTGTSITKVMQIVLNDTCMENNLLKVLTCGQDGRNHLGCCMRSGMSDLCLDLCDANSEDTSTDYSSCIGIPTISLVNCLKEGQYLLPSQPTSVSAINLGQKIMVSWQPPVDNADLVTSYKVQYRPLGNDTFLSRSPVSKMSRTEVLSGLELNQIYAVRVIALASSGASQPSYTVDIATGEVLSSSERQDTIAECCTQKNVSSSCQTYCQATMYFIGGESESLLSCHSELHTIFQCLAGYGNHTPCCARVNVPEHCQRLCEGEVILSWDIVSCMQFVPLISGCMIEGSAILPDHPKNTHIKVGSVTTESAVIEWDRPDNSEPGEWFTVSWKLHYSDLPVWNTAEVVAGTSYEITNLKPATMYNVIVSTVNDKGSSLPELTLVLVTEGLSGDNLTPFNETLCCVEHGVQPDCLKLCVHEFRLSINNTAELLLLGMKCPDALAPMLLCASDGRNHTECCKREMVPDSCLGLCSLTHDSVVDTSVVTCLTFKNQLTTCFDEGKKSLPRMPLEVTVKAIGVYSITIDWLNPGGPNISNYLVQSSLDQKYWMNSMNVTQTFAEVKNLKADTYYYFRVIAVNGTDHSLPSPILAAYTQPVVDDTPGRNWMMLWNSKQDCCAKSSNTSVCVEGCVSGEDINLVQCATDMDRIVACGADGRDHTECCTRFPDFPADCLPYCRGQPGSRDVQSALCLNYIGAMFACFVEGKGVIPTPPQYVKAASSTHTSIIMKWKAPAENCDNNTCTYHALLWTESDQKLIQKKDTQETTTYTFSGLDPDTGYRVSVTAINKYGSSLPSPYVILMTNSDVSGSVFVSQSRSGVINPREKVQLECSAIGAEIDKVKWIRNKQTIGKDNLYVISNVSKEDNGLYTCMATFADKSSTSKDWFLNVRFTPHPVRMNTTNVLPGVRQDTEIECVFTGHPNLVTWTKEGHALQGGAKYIFPALVTNLENGKTTSVLRVKSVVSDDFASYTCNATNQFGSNSISGELQNIYPGTGLPTSVPPKEGKVRDCCVKQGVNATCAEHICKYAIDINAVIANPSLSHCLNYLEEFFYCGSDGKDHSKCCTDGGVAEFCLPMCMGKLPDRSNTLELLQCMSHGETILNCAVNGQQYVPAAPVNVRAQLFYDTVKVMWDFGDNADKVDVYHVWYQSEKKTKDFDGAIRSAKSYKLPSSFVKKGETITVWVVSQNDFGSSHISNKASLQITSLVPKAPKNLQGDLIGGTTIHVKWDPPNTQLKIVKYSVYFNKIGDHETEVNSISTETRLIKLLPNSNYFIRVAAVSADGTGQKSNGIHITTGNLAVSGITSDNQGQTSTSESVGIIVGVILGLIFLVAVIIVGLLLFRRLRVPPPAPRHDTVSFENPQYSTGNGQRVTGLPGDAEENNQFGYGKLHEERDNQHDYLTLEPQTEHTPATLNVDQA